MHVTVTIKMEATSENELVKGFLSHVEACKEHFEELKQKRVFGPPEAVEIRYLVIGGQWREPAVVPPPPAPTEEQRERNRTLQEELDEVD